MARSRSRSSSGAIRSRRRRYRSPSRDKGKPRKRERDRDRIHKTSDRPYRNSNRSEHRRKYGLDFSVSVLDAEAPPLHQTTKKGLKNRTLGILIRKYERPGKRKNMRNECLNSERENVENRKIENVSKRPRVSWKRELRKPSSQL
uniref:Arginine and glutamate-rich protein 1 n=1 Tax=Mesocestoides corti TaxID=53468 RepID=A0A5K3EKB9_MESCO